MSKSMQNIVPLRDGVAKFGADPVRLGVLATAELGQDTDFSDTLAASIQERLISLIVQARKLRRKTTGKPSFSGLDRWMLSRLNEAVRESTTALEKLRVREAINKVLYQLDNDLAWYGRRRGAGKGKWDAGPAVLRKVMEVRARLLAPMAPHTAEEIWSTLGMKGLVSVAKWPEAEGKYDNPLAEHAEELIREALEDTGEILKTTGIVPKRVVFYAAADWKWKVFLRALETFDKGPVDQGLFMRDVMADESLREKGKEAADYATKVFQLARQMAGDQRKLRLATGRLREKEVLAEAVDFFKRELKAETMVWGENETGVQDPKGRARLAEPYRPAIFVE